MTRRQHERDRGRDEGLIGPEKGREMEGHATAFRDAGCAFILEMLSLGRWPNLTPPVAGLTCWKMPKKGPSSHKCASLRAARDAFGDALHRRETTPS